MITLTIVPPADFINANDRLHWAAEAKLTKAWREAVAAQLRARFKMTWWITDTRRRHFERAHIVCTIRFANNIRRDVGNYYPTAKAIVDGLVDAGVLPDDDDAHVLGPDMRREYPNGPPRVTVTITPLQETP